MTHQLHLDIRGTVQGVCFRAETRRTAQALGLTGWVRNTPDGAVAVCAEGAKTALQELAAWCQHGPPSARVRGVTAEWRPATGEWSHFSIHR